MPLGQGSCPCACPVAATRLRDSALLAALLDALLDAVQDDRGLPWALLQRCFFWEDIVGAAEEPGAPDAFMRRRRQVFLQADKAVDGTDLLLGELLLVLVVVLIVCVCMGGWRGGGQGWPHQGRKPSRSRVPSGAVGGTYSSCMQSLIEYEY